MKILTQFGHQGDTQWFSIEKIPENLVKKSKQFIAASEKTGHVHALSGKYDMYEYEDGFVIETHEECILNHTSKELLNEKTWNKPVQLPAKDHRSSIIPKGIYYVGIQQRFNPLSKMLEKVID